MAGPIARSRLSYNQNLIGSLPSRKPHPPSRSHLVTQPSPVYLAGVYSFTNAPVTVQNSTGPGDAIAVWLDSNASGAQSGSDSQGNTYIQIGTVANGNALLVSTYNGSPGTPTVPLIAGVDTFTWSGSTSGGALIIQGVRGIAPVAPDSAPATATGTSSTPSGPATGTLTQAGDIVLAGYLSGTGWTPTSWGGGFAGTYATSSLNGAGLALAYQVAQSTSAVTPSATLSASEAWTGLAVALTPAGAGATTIQATAVLTGQGSLTATPEFEQASVLSGAGTLGGSPEFEQTAGLSGSGSLTGAPVLPAAPALSGSGSLTAAPVLPETAGLTGVGSLAGVPFFVAAAALAGIGTLAGAYTPIGIIATNGADGIANGTTVTTANSGGLSGNPWDTVQIPAGCTITADNADPAAHGPECYLFTTGSTAAAAWVAWTATTFSNSPSTLYMRIYVRMDALPSGNFRLINWNQGTTACAGLNLLTTGAVRLVNASAGTVWTSTALPTGQWVRIEGWLTGDVSAGQAQIRIWSASPDGSGTPDQDSGTQTGIASTGAANGIRAGIVNAVASITVRLDSIGGSTITWLGPDLSWAAALSGQGTLSGNYAELGILSGRGTLTYTPPFYMANYAQIGLMDGIDHATTLAALGGSNSFSVTPDVNGSPPPAPGTLPSGYTTTPMLKYTSYAQLQTDLGVGGTTPASQGYTWLMYDPEFEDDGAGGNAWPTPMAEADDPWTYMADFVTLAHAHGYKVALAPARDLGNNASSVQPNTFGSLDAWYEGTGIATAMAGADICHVQNQVDTTTLTAYDGLWNDSYTKVQTAAPGSVVTAAVSTNFGTPAQMAAAAMSVPARGYWLNSTTATASDAVAFLEIMAGQSPPVPALSGTGTLGAAIAIPATAALTGTGTLSGAPIQKTSTVLSGTGTLGAAPVYSATAVLSGTGTLTGAAIQKTSTVLTGLGTLSATPIQLTTATLSGLGTLTGAAIQKTSTVLSGSGTLSAAPVLAVSAGLSGLGVLGTATVLSVSAALSGLGTLSGLYNGSTAAQLSGVGSLAAAPAFAPAVPLAGLGTLGASGVLAGVVALTGTGALAGAPVLPALSVLSGTGTLSAAPTRGGTAALTGIGQLGGGYGFLVTVTLSGSGSLFSAYQVAYTAAALLAGLGTLGGFPTITSPGNTGTITWTAWPAPPRWGITPSAPRWDAQAAPPRWHITLAAARWHTAPTPPRWRIIMANFEPIAAISPQYVNVNWTAELDGTTIDPTITLLTVQFAFPVSSGVITRPAQPATWFAGVWLAGGTGKGYIAQCLVGPSPGLVQLVSGTNYDVWSRILGTPEQPTLFAGVQPVY